jgi:hypothetical protein
MLRPTRCGKKLRTASRTAHCLRHPIGNWVRTREGLGRTHGSKSISGQKVLGTEKIIRKPSVPRFYGGSRSYGPPPLDRKTVSLIWLRPFAGLRRIFSPRPNGDSSKRTPCRAVALFPNNARRQLRSVRILIAAK